MAWKTNLSTTASREIGDPYENLANAIIMSASMDYVRLLKAYKIAGKMNRSNIVKNIRADEMFFHSRWFGILTSMDADFLLEAMKKEVLGDDYKTIFESGECAESKGAVFKNRD